ncbi:hypothetical protein BST61_g1486 [Cercospora zeina]
MPRQCPEADYGLKVLRDAPSDLKSEEMLDIVAIHGMGAHPDDTGAVLKDGARDSKNPDSYVNWLTDQRLLPAVLPNARIMRYGYVSTWFGGEMVQTRSRKIAKGFLTSLLEARKIAPRRPLILIAHSYGGLVVLKVLANAAEIHPELYDSTAGLVFFGTPFCGAHSRLSQGAILDVLSCAEGDQISANRENLIELQPGAGPLLDLIDDYLNVARERGSPKTVCFYEQKETNVAASVDKTKMEKVLLVDEASASLDMAQKIPRACDHFGLNKFADPSVQAWQDLSRNLTTMAKPKMENSKQARAGVESERRSLPTQTFNNTGSFNNVHGFLQGNIQNHGNMNFAGR